jgi:hypothetical protein
VPDRADGGIQNKMPSLLNLQQAFMSDLEQSTTKDPSHQALFHIYRSSMQGRFQKTLKTIYPVCHQLVGSDFFIGMANGYINQTPSYSTDLNAYGITFATFIAQYPPAASLPYLSDVAHLEWAWHFLYTAPDTQTFDFQKLANQEAAHLPSITFTLPPQSTLIASPYPIHLIWEMNQDNPTHQNDLVLEENKTFYLFLWHQNHQRQMTLLTAPEWQILTWIKQNSTLGELTTLSSSAQPNIPLSDMLPVLIKNGYIENFR